MSEAKFYQRGVNVGCVEHRIGSQHLPIFTLSIKQSTLSSIVLALLFLNLYTTAFHILLFVLDKLCIDVSWFNDQTLGTYSCLLCLLFSLFSSLLQV